MFFGGICAFSHRFVRHASGKMAPLTQLKNISRQKDFEEAWNPVHDRACYATKEAIASATLLVHPLPKAQTEIWCDTSNIAVGAMLVQFQRGVWKPSSFWSKQLNHAQRGYSATDRELLAVSYAVDKFRAYLEGQPIIVRTDYQPLVGSLIKKDDTAVPVPRRHLLKIAQFVDQLHYLKRMNTTFYRKKDCPKRYKRRRWSTIRFSASSSDDGIVRTSNFKHQHVFVARFHPALCLTRYHMLTKQILHQCRPL